MESWYWQRETVLFITRRKHIPSLDSSPLPFFLSSTLVKVKETHPVMLRQSFDLVWKGSAEQFHGMELVN